MCIFEASCVMHKAVKGRVCKHRESDSVDPADNTTDQTATAAIQNSGTPMRKCEGSSQLGEVYRVFFSAAVCTAAASSAKRKKKETHARTCTETVAVRVVVGRGEGMGKR